MTHELNHVDLCFVVDTTGSMGTFIDAAKRELLRVLEAMVDSAGVDLRVGLVQYRDHPPQDNSFVTKCHDLSADFAGVRKQINAMSPGGGGDEAEAVLSGVRDACTKLTWREHSLRFVLLVGDAPPHGYAPWASGAGKSQHELRAHDAWPGGCPSGLDVHQVSAIAEEHRAVVHALCMNPKWVTLESFKDLSLTTGGACVTPKSGNVIKAIRELLDAQFETLPLDRAVFTALSEDPARDADALGVLLDQSPAMIASSMGRLARRGLMPAEA